MSFALCPAINLYMMDLLACNSPEAKITPAGFSTMLFNQGAYRRLDDVVNTGNGTFNNAKVIYTPRTTASDTSDTASCTDINLAYSNLSYTVPDTSFYREISMVLTAEQVKKLCSVKAAWQTKEGASAWAELWGQIKRMANGLIDAVNEDLLTEQSTNWGVNQTTGSALAKTLNLPLSTTTNNLSQGITSLFTDAQLNEFCGELDIVGSGLMMSFTNQQIVQCCNNAGIDTSRVKLNFYPDFKANTIWGNNHIGVFDKGALQLITYNKNRLNMGQMGNTYYGMMPLEVNCPSCLVDAPVMDIDLTLRWHDCPTDMLVGGVAQTIDRAYTLTLSTAYDLVSIPPDAYGVSDRLSGNNGTLLYNVTNV